SDPDDRRKSTVSTRPADVASKSAVLPSSSLAVTLAPEEINFLTASVCPRQAASRISAFATTPRDVASTFAGSCLPPGAGDWAEFVGGSAAPRVESCARSLAASSCPLAAARCAQTIALALFAVPPRPAQYISAKLN